jgi:hypothetical protein
MPFFYAPFLTHPSFFSVIFLSHPFSSTFPPYSFLFLPCSIHIHRFSFTFLSYPSLFFKFPSFNILLSSILYSYYISLSSILPSLPIQFSPHSNHVTSIILQHPFLFFLKHFNSHFFLPHSYPYPPFLFHTKFLAHSHLPHALPYLSLCLPLYLLTHHALFHMPFFPFRFLL